jgi:hypothetical protein
VLTKEAIAEQWLGRVLRTYPGETAAFMAAVEDPFRNPVGNTIKEALGILLDELLMGMNRERVQAALDSIVQIRAVQDFSPSQALEFLFQLKDILREPDAGPGVELLYGRVDEMALAGFDLYVKYRERTFQARVNETRRRVYVLERRLEAR